MPVDKFGRMSDAKTKDTGVSLTYINNNYIRSDGGTPISGSIDMRGNTTCPTRSILKMWLRRNTPTKLEGVIARFIKRDTGPTDRRGI